MATECRWSIVLSDSAMEFEGGLSNLLEHGEFYSDLSCEVNYCGKAEEKNVFLQMSVDSGRADIYCEEKSAFFHSLLCLAENGGSGGGFTVKRSLRFEKMAALIDISRNAVYTVKTLKRFFCRLALLGYSSCYLYMEDLYRLPEYPMFGYLRGSFSKDELKELDSFAASLGIELIPCIQALAHLRTALRWKCMDPVRDTDENLLVGDDATYELIDVMLRELGDTFSSKRIHLGMDEAMMIGKGTSSQKFGYIPAAALMKEHLTRVSELVKKYGLKPIVWDDMLFRSADVTGSYYGLRTNEALSGIHSDLQYTYWDYYHENKKHYESQLKARKNLDVIFAGGIWKWTGFVPGYKKTWDTSYPAMEVCQKYKVKEIIATIWGDDSGETPLDAILPGLALFGEHRFTVPDNKTIDSRCRILSGVPLNDYFAVEEMDFLPGYPKHNFEGTNPSKQIFYSDIFCGLFDWHYGNDNVAKHYGECSAAMRAAAGKAPAGSSMSAIFEMYAKMADYLEKKAPLGRYLRQAYKKKDKERLQSLMKDVENLIPMINAFHEDFIRIWSRSCKGQGLEVMNLRLGGLSGRMGGAAMRLRMYLDNEIDALDELEQEILPYDGIRKGRPPISYHANIVTANTLSHMW